MEHNSNALGEAKQSTIMFLYFRVKQSNVLTKTITQYNDCKPYVIYLYRSIQLSLVARKVRFFEQKLVLFIRTSLFSRVYSSHIRRDNCEFISQIGLFLIDEVWFLRFFDLLCFLTEDIPRFIY